MSWAWPCDRRVPPPASVQLPGVTARLACVGDLARVRTAVVDIGTDHARLPLAMIRAGWAASAIGIDRAEGPLAGAWTRLRRAGMTDRISLRLGEGLTPLAPGEVETVVIAGVGGTTAARILDPARLAALGARRVVVQPNRDDILLRGRLAEVGWPVVDEELVYDGGRLFYVAAAEPGPTAAPTTADLWVGPVLRHRDGPLVDAYRALRRRWLRQRQDLDPAVRAAALEALGG